MKKISREKLKMKKIHLSALAFFVCIIIIMTGCSYLSYKDYYTEIDDYEKIWELTGYYHDYNGKSTFFPNSIKGLSVNKFFCRYDQQIPLGEGFQIFLEIKYTEKSNFDNEIHRIESISTVCDNEFIESGLIAYATHLGDSGYYEYALIEVDEMTIRFVYLQNVPKDEIEFDPRFFPDKYMKYSEDIAV